MKNMRSSLLKFSTVLTVLATNAVFGWQLGIANYTSVPVALNIAYVWGSCSADSVTVQPGQIIHVDAGFGCLVDDIIGVAIVNGKNIELTKGGYGTIGGRDFSINVIEIGSGADKTYRIERVM